MQIKKKRLSIVLAIFVALLAFLVLGCTPGSDDTTDRNPEDETPIETEADIEDEEDMDADDSEEVETDNENLDSTAGDGYTFYYPSYYEAYDNPQQELSFRSTEMNDLGGANNIGANQMDLGSEIGEGDKNACDEMANGVSSVYTGEILSSEHSSKGGTEMCTSKVTADMGDGFIMVIETKALWKADESTIYTAATAYEEDSTKEEIQDLQSAMSMFQLN
ncbi:hypothetical protein GF362_02265 [Candidatus Dojkabacteria bacterium]|nr:hypothetical protein [Candidatus Dojkabacteria bacterium]